MLDCDIFNTIFMAGKIRFRTCKVKSCGKKYEVNPKYPLFPCCSVNCAYEYQKVLRANKLAKENKEERKELFELKKSILTHKDWIKMYQTVFNTWIRLRDKDLQCISCDTPMINRKGDASHYYPTTYQFLRFNEDNVHLGCVTCNQYKHGNLQEYLPRIEKKIGVDKLQWLHAHRHDVLKISIPEIQEKIKYYKQLIKTLKP